MSSEKIRGIIIRENFSGEADKFLTVFAKDVGKISVYAKGARNTKSKFLAASSLFTYADFMVRTATKTPTLLSADVIENFYNSKINSNKRLIGCIFQLRLLDLLGYRPDEIEIKPYSLNQTSIYAMKYILSSDLNSAFSVNIDIEYIKELETFLEKYIEYHIDIKFNSYKLIKNLVLTN